MKQEYRVFDTLDNNKKSEFVDICEEIGILSPIAERIFDFYYWILQFLDGPGFP